MHLLKKKSRLVSYQIHAEPVDPQTGQPIGDLGAPIQEPDLESEGGATEAPTIPSGGEI